VEFALNSNTLQHDFLLAEHLSRDKIGAMHHETHLPRLNRFIRTLSLFKVPLLGLCRPKVLELSDSMAKVQLPHEFLTKNHLGSMYFGALAMGAELSIALRLLERMRSEKIPVSFIFKDFSCEFHKRAEEDVHFCTEEIKALDDLIDRALSSEDRQNGTFKGYAVGASDPSTRLMSYQITISLKKFSRTS